MFEHRPFGTHLRLSIRGASHAPDISFSLEGFPQGFAVDDKALAAFMARRAPGRDALSTARTEADDVVFDAGLAAGTTTGETITGHIANTNVRPDDYGGVARTIPRPGHADFGQWIEQGRIPTGGGANSGRMTVALCAVGGLCLQYLERRGIHVEARLLRVEGHDTDFEETILTAKRAGDSVGGEISCVATGLPGGLGGALFAGIESELSAALFAIPGVKGLSFGNGFEATTLRGSANDDAFVIREGRVETASNRHGGLLGGRTTGMPMTLTIAMKPTPTVFKPLPSVDLATMTETVCRMKGRHDPCIVRRAVPVVEAAVAFVLTDLLLASETATPRICLTLTGRTLAEDKAQYEAERYFADLMELRVDLLNVDERAKATTFPKLVDKPVILTFRRQRDGGAFAGDESERVAFFHSALTPETGFAYVDFEDDFRVPELTKAARNAQTRIIRSKHVFNGPVPDAPAVCRALRGSTDEIPKLAFMPRTLADVTRLFIETRDFNDTPHILCAMGPMGLATRVLALRTHSFLTYASVAGLETLGHCTPHTLVETYRMRVLDHSATLYGVTGYPLAFTRSPELNNAAFAAADRDALMVPLPSPNAEDALAFMKVLHLRGMAVTIPHKKTIMPLLDILSDEAQAVGAVNTIVCEQGRYVGYNTDVEGFSKALRAFLGLEQLSGRRVAVLGDGGASKAVVHALNKLGASVEVFHRRPLTEGFDVIVNATPVDPIPDYAFTGREAVYDLVYEPPLTPLMARAQAAGCRVENGLSMLAAQARAQRKIWENL